MELAPQKCREIILQLLYSFDFSDEKPEKETMMFLMKYHKISKKRMYEIYEYVSEIHHHLKSIDQLIEETVDNYEFERISNVEKNILRLGFYEISKHKKEIPAKVVICEGIRLARKFSTRQSASFVNAIFDKFYKKTCGHEV